MEADRFSITRDLNVEISEERIRWLVWTALLAVPKDNTSEQLENADVDGYVGGIRVLRGFYLAEL